MKPRLEEITIKVPPGKFCLHNAYCPRGHSLMTGQITFGDRKSIQAQVRVREHYGTIYLSPFFGNFEHKCDLPLQDGDVVELSCPECQASLHVDSFCPMCHVPMFAVQIPAGGEVRACPVVGCHNHQLTIVDLDAQLAAYYDDELRPKM